MAPRLVLLRHCFSASPESEGGGWTDMCSSGGWIYLKYSPKIVPDLVHAAPFSLPERRIPMFGHSLLHKVPFGIYMSHTGLSTTSNVNSFMSIFNAQSNDVKRNWPPKSASGGWLGVYGWNRQTRTFMQGTRVCVLCLNRVTATVSQHKQMLCAN